jgi:FAD/FMN-containing dehydrogenase
MLLYMSNPHAAAKPPESLTNEATAPASRVSPEVEASFGGALLVDRGSRDEYAGDFGHIVNVRPRAVLRPQSGEDVARAIQVARRQGLKVTARGFGNSMYGHAQVEDGILIDMSSLHEVDAIGPDWIRVGAGARWEVVAEAAIGRGMTPPVLTDYLDLSVGGTLSVGGNGRTTHRYGMQVDTVVELEVVTGSGELVTCSPTREPLLFESMLGGLGQFGIIVRATIRLLPAPARARHFRIVYQDLDAFLRDQLLVAEGGRFDGIFSAMVPGSSGGWLMELELSSYYTPPSAPDEGALLAGLSATRSEAQVEDRSYIEHLRAPGAQLAQIRAAGQWNVPHPWLDVFIPASRSFELISGAMSRLSAADIGSGMIALCPMSTAKLRAPLVRVPSEPMCFVLDVAKFASSDANNISNMIADNRDLYERVLAIGGTLYPVGAVPMTCSDWRRHYGPLWERIARAKRAFDPDGILTSAYRDYDLPGVAAPDHEGL